MLFSVVVYQSRTDYPSVRTYFSRFWLLLKKIWQFIRNAITCIVDASYRIDWNLTKNDNGSNRDFNSITYTTSPDGKTTMNTHRAQKTSTSDNEDPRSHQTSDVKHVPSSGLGATNTRYDQ